jgi:hypothetical protein
VDAYQKLRKVLRETLFVDLTKLGEFIVTEEPHTALNFFALANQTGGIGICLLVVDYQFEDQAQERLVAVRLGTDLLVPDESLPALIVHWQRLIPAHAEVSVSAFWKRFASTQAVAGYIQYSADWTAMTILQIAVVLYLFHRGLRVQREPTRRCFRHIIVNSMQ